jgi:hypothetical protein
LVQGWGREKEMGKEKERERGKERGRGKERERGKEMGWDWGWGWGWDSRSCPNDTASSHCKSGELVSQLRHRASKLCVVEED